MVAGSFSMDKEAPSTITAPHHVVPEVELTRKPKSSRGIIAVASWASTVTAVLVVVLIWGAVYVTDLKARECTTPASTAHNHNTKDFQCKYENKKEGTTEKENIHVDEADQTELIVKKDDDGNINLIAAIDYKTKISTAYSPIEDECYLIAGSDSDYWDSWGNQKNKTVVLSPEDVFQENYKVSDNKVTDLSILPRAIRPFCSGKANYWVQPDDGEDDEDDGGVEKRAVCVYVYVYRCYIVWGRRVCVRVRVLRCW